MGQQLRQGDGFVAALRSHQVHREIIPAEFPHHLAAHAAGGEGPGNDAALAAAYGQGGKVPVPVIHGLENGGPLCADGGAEGGIFDVAALIHRAVLAQ